MRGDGAVARNFWNALYGRFSGSGVGAPNRLLVAEVGDLTPATALDLGCAHGADALWLAQRGWHVTAVDVSEVALAAARENAARADLADRIDFERRDLGADFPLGLFALVSAQFLHSPVAALEERGRILRQAAAAVAPRGDLLVASHYSVPAWHPALPAGLTTHPLDLTVLAPEETIAALELAEGEWDTLRAEIVATEIVSPAGEAGIREDHVLHYRRR